MYKLIQDMQGHRRNQNTPIKTVSQYLNTKNIMTGDIMQMIQRFQKIQKLMLHYVNLEKAIKYLADFIEKIKELLEKIAALYENQNIDTKVQFKKPYISWIYPDRVHLD